jgi:hypothetical protein
MYCEREDGDLEGLKYWNCGLSIVWLGIFISDALDMADSYLVYNPRD